MIYSGYQSETKLSHYIQSIWSLEADHENDIYPRSLILPDGIVEVVFHWGEPFTTWHAGREFKQPQSFVVSMMREYLEIASNGYAGFVAVRFFPWGAYHFFNLPIRNFLDETIDAQNLWGNEAADLVKTLKSAKTLDERFKHIEQFLLEKLAQFQKNENETEGAIRLIRDRAGNVTIDEVIDKTGMTKKQLERKFLATVGTTPKVFARVSRFIHICNNLEDYKEKNLTELAYECGFFDQAHFIKEFKSFCGFTPKEFFKKDNVYFSEL